MASYAGHLSSNRRIVLLFVIALVVVSLMSTSTIVAAQSIDRLLQDSIRGIQKSVEESIRKNEQGSTAPSQPPAPSTPSTPGGSADNPSGSSAPVARANQTQIPTCNKTGLDANATQWAFCSCNYNLKKQPQDVRDSVCTCTAQKWVNSPHGREMEQRMASGHMAAPPVAWYNEIDKFRKQCMATSGIAPSSGGSVTPRSTNRPRAGVSTVTPPANLPHYPHPQPGTIGQEAWNYCDRVSPKAGKDRDARIRIAGRDYPLKDVNEALCSCAAQKVEMGGLHPVPTLTRQEQLELASRNAMSDCNRELGAGH